jgi:5'-3' exonuclease
MRVHLVDGTYELFRQHFGSVRRHADAHPFAAAAGVVGSTLELIADGATHVGVASDHVIESFRNDLWPGYKTSEGMDPEILVQIPVMEEALEAAGFTVWPMVEYEADDALGAAAKVADHDERVEQVLIVTADKDLGQCVRGTRVVQFDRRNRVIVDAAGVREKFGIDPASIPDYLGLVGDTADGFPGLPGWGAKSTALVLARYEHLEQIPPAAGQWDVPGLRGAAKLSATLQDQIGDAVLFRTIATIDDSVEVGAVDDWDWRGPTAQFESIAERIGSPHLAELATTLVRRRPSG